MIENLYSRYRECTGVSIDTRTINSGEMFFAIKGDNFDANDYIDVALNAGAKYIITDQKSSADQYEEAILVDSVIKTLQELAKFHRSQFDIPFIGITGSNGKTTTKELVHAVLSTKYKTYATKGNLNNHLGVPLTVLSIDKDCEIAIIEMGANHVGEIELLCEIAQPTHGLITNIGKAHLEGFGSIEGVIQGKTELYKSLNSINGIVFYNSSSEVIKENLPSNTKNVPYGDNIEVVSSYPTLNFIYKDLSFYSYLIGGYNAINITCAVTIGQYFDIETSKIQDAVKNYNPDMNRSQVIRKNNFTLISDAYNANPISMNAAIENFKSIKHPKKVIIIGDMLELGNESSKEHQAIVDSLEGVDFEVILVGALFSQTNTPFKTFTNIKEVQNSNTLDKLFLEDSLILIKGSRGIALEKLFNDID